MLDYKTSDLYAYGVLVPLPKFLKKKATKSLTPYVEEVKNLWDEKVKASINLVGAHQVSRNEHYLDIKEEVEYENRDMTVEDFSHHAEAFSSLLEHFLFRNFPLLRATVLVLDEENNDENILICVDRNVLYLEWAKTEDKKKPSKQEKEQLREFLALIGVKDKPEWDTFVYVDTP